MIPGQSTSYSATVLWLKMNGSLTRHLKALAVLFPVTKPIPSISDWSVDGLVKYVDSEESKQLRANVRKEVFHKSKLHAEDAFERKNYAIAAGWYNTAIKESPCDATLLSRRSLCYSLAGCGNAALSDAQACVCLRERITQMQ
ncbi:unnamed protein product [Cuscuta campestris]|uniref:Uncharacterized protein n=1 Tax=Cuscuta campestris TaxID=132261 RepID=A0A484KJ40_9ASTE|nr:unnamed protein product [Cuscuta campestris]